MANRLVILRTQLNRCFSTSTSFFQQPKSPLPTPSDSSSSSLVTPPIPVFGLEGRYASALFSAASKQNKLDRLLTQNKSFIDLFRNPGVTREQRLTLINELGLSDMTKSTIETLVDNRREKN
jgi:F-type H+-transporting ATPase subunit O